jgi:hypothetical protein
MISTYKNQHYEEGSNVGAAGSQHGDEAIMFPCDHISVNNEI